MKTSATYAVQPGAQVPQNYDYALFRLHDGVTQGTSTSSGIVDANPTNTWTLDADNFNSAIWTTKNSWWTGALASDRALSVDFSSYASENSRFAADEVYDGACVLVACEIDLPSHATAAQRIFSLGVNNNAERFQLRYITGDILQFLCGDNDVVSGSLDITSFVTQDLVFVGIIDDRPGFETISARIYQSGTTNLIASVSASTASATWLTSASARFLNIGSLPNTPTGNPMTGSVRRFLMVPFGTSPPPDFTVVSEELALYSLTRFETL